MAGRNRCQETRLVSLMSAADDVMTNCNNDLAVLLPSGFEVITAEVDDTGPFRPPVTRSSSLNITVNDEIRGKRHAYRARAIGTVSGVFYWWDVVVRLAA